MKRYRTKRVDGRTMFEHILIVESVLGRKLPAGAVVHHVDGDPSNNAHSNLVLCPSQAYHMLLHARARTLAAGANPDTHRVCSKCRVAKPFSDFHKKLLRLHDACKPCRVKVRDRMPIAQYQSVLRARRAVIQAGGNPDMERRCSTCRRVLPLDAFNRRLSSKSVGLQTACRECQRSYQAAYTRPSA